MKPKEEPEGRTGTCGKDAQLCYPTHPTDKRKDKEIKYECQLVKDSRYIMF